MKTVRKNIAALVVATMCMVSTSETRAEDSQTLSGRHKAMIPIAAFTATGNMQKLETALGEGLDAGLTVNEIKEILVHTYAYAGFPRALNGIDTCMAVLDERREKGSMTRPAKRQLPCPPILIGLPMVIRFATRLWAAIYRNARAVPGVHTHH